MLKNPFKNLKKREWVLMSVSVAVVLLSNIASGKIEIVTLTATLFGVIGLVFLARGDVWGQILSVVFSILYAVNSYRFHYYGEMITYLGMIMPIAALSVVSWLRNPYEKGKNEVKIHRLTKLQTVLLMLATAAVTALFYFLLKALDTPNLLFSTLSITTSFLASSLMLLRNSYYAVAYAGNDIVLIVLWVLAAIEDIKYLPMIACFAMFLVNDLYGFISWKKREKKQNAKSGTSLR